MNSSLSYENKSFGFSKHVDCMDFCLNDHSEKVIFLLKEAGWLERDSDRDAFISYLNRQGASTVVAAVDSKIEGLAVAEHNASMNYMFQTVNLTVIDTVCASGVSRGMGVASMLVARQLANAADNGLHLASLGVFDQGFYDRLGFGSCIAEPLFCFDPLQLICKQERRTPERLGEDNFLEIYECLLNGVEAHGVVRISNPEWLKLQLKKDNISSFGFRNKCGKLTHFISIKEISKIAIGVVFCSFSCSEEFFDLLSLLRSFGDQIYSIYMTSPPKINLSDCLLRPTRFDKTQKRDKTTCRVRTQFRILDLFECIEKVKLPSSEKVSFNLRISDPLTDYLSEGGGINCDWRGVSGEYVIHLGEESFAERGRDNTLEYMEASISAFTRLWLGVAQASTLCFTDEMSAPAKLLSKLDRYWVLPPVCQGIHY